jgi:hypothetical protein
MSDAASQQITAALSPAAAYNLKLYELQKPFVEPMLRFFRLGNTALDALFYDVGALTATLLAQHTLIITGKLRNASSPDHPLQTLDLSAATNPSGSIIIVDAQPAAVVRPPFRDMKQFIDFANSTDGAKLRTLTITGVGSSAYGAVAFAWDVSQAIGEPVAAVVPGYGLADVVPQALGGWFGFGMYDALQSATQSFLATFAPPLAMMGKELARSTPGRIPAGTGAPVFRHGSAASDDVHAILNAVPGISRLVGHSKGALAIENALRSLKSPRAEPISVVTLGCVIKEELEFPRARYEQYLGRLDALGSLNSWNRPPEHRPFTHHSTNSAIPLSMQVASSVAESREDGRNAST